MKQCDYCEDNTPATSQVTIKDAKGVTVPTFNKIPLCEDHTELVNANMQMVNMATRMDHFSMTIEKVQP